MCVAISPERRPAPRAAQPLLVHDEVHGLAHVDVVERGLGQVQRDVPRPVARADVQDRRQLLVLDVLADHLRRLARDRVLELAGLDLVEDVVGVRVDRELEAVDEVLARLGRVGRRVVVRVAHERQRRVRVEARDRLERVAARRVERVRALEHVRAGRDQVATVLAGLGEAARDLARDGAGGGHREAEGEVARRRRQREDDRLVVRGRRCRRSCRPRRP